MNAPDVDADFDRLAARPDAVLWTMSVAGEITEISDSVAAVRGYTPQEAMHQGVDDIHPPQSLRTSLAYFERFSRDLIEGRMPPAFSDRLEYRCKDGSTVLCDVMAVPVVDEDGQVRTLRGVSAPVAP